VLLARNRHTIRLFAGSIGCLTTLVVMGGVAHAEDAPSPHETSSDPASTAPTSPTDATPAADTPPADTTPTTGAAPSNIDHPPADTPPADTPPADTSPPDNSSSSGDTPTTTDTTPPIDNTNDQQADVTNSGTAVSNTGSNNATAGTNSNAAGVDEGQTGASANAGATTGTAGSTGSQDATQIQQAAMATADGQAAVDILQVALVINLGVSNGQTGSNVAVAAGGPGGAGGDSQGVIDTGDTSAVGNRAETTVTQAAIVGGGDASTQIAAVFNIGIGAGNSGLNVAYGTVTVDGASAAQLTLLNSGSAGVATGNADALGNRSDTRVLQSATGTASGTAVLQIGQWAIVLNFGTAFANTGGNAAVAGAGPAGMSPAEYQAVLAIMNVLAPILDGLGTPTGSQLGNSTALVTTGNASALGNDAQTAINQIAAGSVSGDEYATATQRATVANLGLALANTGYNAALANPGAFDMSGLTPAATELSRFFGLLADTSWLSSANPFASFAQSIDLGGVTLNLGGDISGTQFLLGWDDALVPDDGPLTAGVRVRQISAVLNIGIAIADSGSNVALSLARGDNTTTSSDVQALLSTVASTNEGVAANGSALARIATGDATAIGSHALVTICQAFNDNVACAPNVELPSDPGTPVTPTENDSAMLLASTPTANPTPAARPASDPGDAAATLPFTGGDPQALLTAALGLIGVGGVLTRRRRTAG
jgi:hypothetical protein